MTFKDRLKIAGNELVRANFGNVLKSFTTTQAATQTLSPSTYRNNGFWMFGNDGQDTHFNYTDNNSALTAYQTCPPLAAIITRKAQAFINGKTWVLNAKGKEATNPQAKKILNLLRQPNPLQNWKHFEAQGYIYQQVFGYNVVMPLTPIGFPNEDAKSLWNIPPYMLEITEKDTLFYTANSIRDCIESISLVYKNRKYPLPLEQLYIFKDFTPSMDSLFLPESRIRALAQPINNIIGAYESRNVLINRRGPMSVISSEKTDESGNIPLTPAEKDEIEKDFHRKFGLRAGQVQHILTAASIKIQSVGFATKELMLFEEIQDDIMRICDAYAYPADLMSKMQGSTFDNVTTADRQLYTNAIIPEARNIYEQWDLFFSLDETNLHLEKDFSEEPALQEDKNKAASARKMLNDALLIEWKNDMLKKNRWLELLGEDTLGPEGDVYFSQTPEGLMASQQREASLAGLLQMSGQDSNQNQNTSNGNNGQNTQSANSGGKGNG